MQIDYSQSLIAEREDAIKEIESTMLEVTQRTSISLHL